MLQIVVAVQIKLHSFKSFILQLISAVGNVATEDAETMRKRKKKKKNSKEK